MDKFRSLLLCFLALTPCLAFAQKFSELPPLSSPATGDYILSLDVSDTTAGPGGSAKKFALSGLITFLGGSFQGLDSHLTTWAGITPAAGVGTFLGAPTTANINAATTDDDFLTLTGTQTASSKTFVSPNITTKILPTTDDGAALGDSTHHFSDLFLATGAVINFQAGNYTLTHSSGQLTASGPFSIGTSAALTAGTIELGAASDTTISRTAAGLLAVEGVAIPTISSTNTLTNKTLTAPVLNGTITGTYTFAGTPTFPAAVTLDSEWDTTLKINAATTDDDFMTLTGVESGTNKTFISPAITTGMTTGSTTFALLNTNVTTVNAFGTTTALNIGANAATILNLGGHTTAAELHFLEPSASGTNYTAFKAQAQAANITYTLPTTVGSAGTYLYDANGDGTLSWHDQAAGTGGDVTAASVFGADNRIIRADGTGKGVQASGVTIDDSNNATGFANLTAAGLISGANTAALGTVKLFGSTSGDATIQPQAVAGTATVVTLPNASSTLPIFGQQITFAGPTAARTITLPDAAFTVARTDAANTFTGTQTFTAPVLGTPASGNASNMTVDGTNAVGFRTIPQNSQSAAYTTVLADSGKHIFHPAADTTARNFTIDSNANVAYPIGTALTFVNETLGGVVTIKITSDTLLHAADGTTGDYTLAASKIATALKITTTKWIISP